MTKKYCLPEKDYFTRAEVAKRWECELDLVVYYIAHGMLREAFRSAASGTFELQTSSYFKCKSDSAFFSVYASGFYHDADFLTHLKRYDLELDSNDIVPCPEFAYLSDPAYLFPAEIEVKPYIDTDCGPYMEDDPEADDCSNNRQQIMFLTGLGTEKYIPIRRRSNENSSDKNIWDFNRLYKKQSETLGIIIPREEVERFEACSSISSAHNSSAQENPSSGEMTKTTEDGYLVTIGLFAKLLAKTDKQYRKSDGSANIIKMARAAESVGLSLEGHLTEVLKKRITAGINTLKEIS